jgi:hypothetical protein
MFICFSDENRRNDKRRKFEIFSKRSRFQLRAAGVSHQICVRESVGRSAGMAARRQDNVAADWGKQKIKEQTNACNTQKIDKSVGGLMASGNTTI